MRGQPQEEVIRAVGQRRVDKGAAGLPLRGGAGLVEVQETLQCTSWPGRGSAAGMAGGQLQRPSPFPPPPPRPCLAHSSWCQGWGRLYLSLY